MQRVDCCHEEFSQQRIEDIEGILCVGIMIITYSCYVGRVVINEYSLYLRRAFFIIQVHL